MAIHCKTPSNWRRQLLLTGGIPVLVALLLVAIISRCQPASAPDRQPLVAVVEGDNLGPGGEAMAPRMKRYLQATCAALRAARVPFLKTSDSAIEKQGLPPVAVAILPYNRAVSDAELGRILRFMDGGGKLVVCYVGRSELLSRLGVVPGKFAPSSRPGEYARVKLSASDIVGLPQTLEQATDSIRQAQPGPQARVIGYWEDTSGASDGKPAVIVSPSGAYLSHVPAGELAGQGALLRALCGYYAPGVWEQAIPTTASSLGPVGPYTSLAEFIDVIQRRVDPERYRALRRALKAGDSLFAARGLLENGNLQEAIAMSQRAAGQANEAYWMSYPSVPGELRGCWMTADPKPSWDEAMKNLAAAHFNTVFPYFASAGTAFYNSSVLPKNPDCGSGDPLAEAVAAAHKYGLKIYPRMLNLECLFASPQTVQAFKAQGRTMISASGESCGWLCPSDPRNRKLEVQIALELVTGYDTDGLQFDYLRYPGLDYCFCAGCRQRFEAETGVKVANWPADVRNKGPLAEKYADWRREQITHIVADIAAAVRKARPGLPISASVFMRWDRHRIEFGQDWVPWLQQGLVDFVCPMDYTSKLETFREYVSLQQQWLGDKYPWAAGIGPFATNVNLDVQGVVDQIQLARNFGARGFVLFNYQPGLAQDFLPYLGEGISSEPTEFALRR